MYIFFKKNFLIHRALSGWLRSGVSHVILDVRNLEDPHSAEKFLLHLTGIGPRNYARGSHFAKSQHIGVVVPTGRR